MIILNVGGNSKHIDIPKFYDGWDHHLLDIDPKGSPDICCDATLLKNMTEYKGQYDSVYCSHTMEHFYKHKVKDVLDGFHMVTNDYGFCYIAVPHIMNILRTVIAFNMDLTDTLYELSGGAKITPHDVMFGWGAQIEHSGDEFFSHKCAFSPNMLKNAIAQSGFQYVYTAESHFNLVALGFKKEQNEETINAILSPKTKPEKHE